MKVSLHQIQLTMESPLPPPSWSEKVPRWYQLDNSAFVLSQLFYEAKFQFDYLVLACPGASNSTDLEFVRSGASRAQKFVHTLPNIRAAMALQVDSQVCRFTCLQNGSQTIGAGFNEFTQLCEEGFTCAFATLYPIDIDENSQRLQTYRATLIARNPTGDWLVSEAETPTLTDSSCIKSWNENSRSLGKFKLEKIN